MTVYLIGAGPGDPGLLTRRGAELLGTANAVVYDRLVSRALLSLAPPTAELFDVGKRPINFGDGIDLDLPANWTNSDLQRDINELLVRLGRSLTNVVRLKGGDPFFFGRGGEEAQALGEAGIEWQVVPGVTSAVAVSAYAGIPITHRSWSSYLTVVTGHRTSKAETSDRVKGVHLETDKDSSDPDGVDWESLATLGGTLVVLMGMRNRSEIVKRLLAGGKNPSTPVAVIQWGTTPRQRTARTTLQDLEKVDLGSPAVIVIGEVANLDLDWNTSIDRGLLGYTVAVTREKGTADGLSIALGDKGAVAVEFPLIETDDPPNGTLDLQRVASRVSEYEWIVFSSANAVRRFIPVLRDSRSLGTTLIAAVGKATAEALASFNLVADLVPKVSSGAGLADEFPLAFDAHFEGASLGPSQDASPGRDDGKRDRTSNVGRVLYPCAKSASPILARSLRSKGWTVDEVVTYVTRSVLIHSDELLEQVENCDVVTFTSPSTVAAYQQIRRKSGKELRMPKLAACIGPVTAQAAIEAGMEAVIQSPCASVESLVDELVKVLGANVG